MKTLTSILAVAALSFTFSAGAMAGTCAKKEGSCPKKAAASCATSCEKKCCKKGGCKKEAAKKGGCKKHAGGTCAKKAA